MGQVKKIAFIDDGSETTFVSGVFNILHPGHRRFLDFAASQNKKLIQQNQELRNENDILKIELDVQKNDNRYKSFLFGGITVFLGALLSVLIPKLKGRKRLSEWG